MQTPDFDRHELIPAVVQDASTRRVLMLGYMNQAAYEHTIRTGRVTFFSRSKNRLWTKGETSGHYLKLVEIKTDCDGDALLVYAIPQGPVCHTGQDTCWNESNLSFDFLYELQYIIRDRKLQLSSHSYTAQLLQKGVDAVAQKVGEEAVETIIEAVKLNKEKLLEESADLLFHLITLLEACNCSLEEVTQILKNRHTKTSRR